MLLIQDSYTRNWLSFYSAGHHVSMYSILHDSDLSTDRPRKPIKCPERLAKIFRIGIGFVKCCPSNISPRPFDFQSVEYARLVLPSMFSRDWNCRLFDMPLSSVASFEMPCRSPGGETLSPVR